MDRKKTTAHPATRLGTGFPQWPLWAGLAALCLAAALWRLGVYAPLEPITDQVFLIQWIKRLRLASHVLPVAGDTQSFLQALMQDDHSLLNIYLRQVYAAQVHVFTVFSVIWFYAWSFVAGTAIDGQVAISIVTSSAAVFALSLSYIFTFTRAADERRALARGATAVLCVVLVAANGFMSDFSATGAHNASILAFFCALVFTARWLRAGGFAAGSMPTTGTFLVQIVALYTYYTNVFLLPPATFLAIIFAAGGTWPGKLRHAGLYAGFILLVMTPALALIAIDAAGLVGVSSSSTFVHVGREVVVSGTEVIGNALHRLVVWIHAHAGMLGGAMLVAGIAGLLALWWIERAALFFFVLVAHLVASSALKGFSYFQKTSGYIVPVLLLGAAYLTVRGFATAFSCLRPAPPWKYALVAAGLVPAVVTCFYMYTEMSRFHVYPRQSRMATHVIKGQQLRHVIADLDSKLRPGTTIIPGDDQAGQIYMAYSPRAGVEVGVFRPLDTLIAKKTSGQLGDYIARRGLALPPKETLALLLAPTDAVGARGDKISNLFGPDGFGLTGPVRLEHVHTWATGGRGSAIPALGLYRIR